MPRLRPISREGRLPEESAGGVNSQPAQGLHRTSARDQARIAPSATGESFAIDAAMRIDSRPAAGHMSEAGGRLVMANGTLPAALLVGAGLGLALLSLMVASVWQWIMP